MKAVLTRTQSDADRSQSILSLTDAGRGAFVPLDTVARRDAGARLAALPDSDLETLLDSMRQIETLLHNGSHPPWSLRLPEARVSGKPSSPPAFPPPARGIYQAVGFRMTASAPHSDFGPAMVGEDWELGLAPVLRSPA